MDIIVDISHKNHNGALYLLLKKMHIPLRMCIFFRTFAEKFGKYGYSNPTP